MRLNRAVIVVHPFILQICDKSKTGSLDSFGDSNSQKSKGGLHEFNVKQFVAKKVDRCSKLRKKLEIKLIEESEDEGIKHGVKAMNPSFQPISKAEPFSNTLKDFRACYKALQAHKKLKKDINHNSRLFKEVYGLLNGSNVNSKQMNKFLQENPDFLRKSVSSTLKDLIKMSKFNFGTSGLSEMFPASKNKVIRNNKSCTAKYSKSFGRNAARSLSRNRQHGDTIDAEASSDTNGHKRSKLAKIKEGRRIVEDKQDTTQDRIFNLTDIKKISGLKPKTKMHKLAFKIFKNGLDKIAIDDVTEPERKAPTEEDYDYVFKGNKDLTFKMPEELWNYTIPKSKVEKSIDKLNARMKLALKMKLSRNLTQSRFESYKKQVESEEKVKINQTLPEVNVKERILDLKKSLFGNKLSSSEYYTDSKYTSIPKNRLVNIQTNSQSPLMKTPGIIPQKSASTAEKIKTKSLGLHFDKRSNSIKTFGYMLQRFNKKKNNIVKLENFLKKIKFATSQPTKPL
ncbi:unnamed protein product [Moneuplotes crassus]|uniref:Uncharacterized protein n=1 Tax=Euplotes crassus TaxID=5936 RepID=A0AAD1Y272_EUPCR|nr:unnamed protein product [Moneuplotes crassus]